MATLLRRIAPVLLAWAALTTAGCDRAPAAPTVASDVAARVRAAIPEDVVTVVSVERRGTMADNLAPPGQTRRIVYFDAQLRLARDYDFGSWEAAGAGGLVSALGTGPKGLTGITTGGNRKGDLLKAHGTAVYQRVGDGWKDVAAEGFVPVAAGSFDTGAQRPAAERLLGSIASVLDSAPPEVRPLALKVTEQELSRAQAAIRGRLARASAGYPMAAGPANGQYLRLARALSQVGGVRVTPLVTQGGAENLDLLQAGAVSLAITQGDLAAKAFEGRGPFTDSPVRGLRAVGSLYPEPVHVVVRNESAIRSVRDLRGKRVSIGPEGSASRGTALDVLEAHGLRPRDLGRSEPLELDAGLRALRDGELDALIQVIGAPADSLRAAAALFPIRLVPLDADAVERLATAGAAQMRHQIAAGTYDGQTAAVPTIAVAAVLLVDPSLTIDEVAAITRDVYAGGRDLASRGSAQGAQIAAQRATLGLTVPQHAGARDALARFRESDSRPGPK
jgi:TRAP transporter TAXI family solute receptor